MTIRLWTEKDSLRAALERIASASVPWNEDEAGEIMQFAHQILEETREQEMMQRYGEIRGNTMRWETE
jgi:Mg2+ and Co2+ transporter CorA